MDFDPNKYVIPALILGLATAGPLPGKKRDDGDVPHTHNETQVPLTPWGRASIEMFATSTGGPTSIWNPATTPQFELNRIPLRRLLGDRW
jgi:hypothetical protein